MSRPMEEDAPGKTEAEEFNTSSLSVLMMSVKKTLRCSSTVGTTGNFLHQGGLHTIPPGV